MFGLKFDYKEESNDWADIDVEEYAGLVPEYLMEEIQKQEGIMPMAAMARGLSDW